MHSRKHFWRTANLSGRNYVQNKQEPRNPHTLPSIVNKVGVGDQHQQSPQSSGYSHAKSNINQITGQDIFTWGRRRPEQIRIGSMQMNELPGSRNAVTNKWIKLLWIFSWLLIADGGILSLGIFISGSDFGSSIYFRLFMTRNVWAMWLLMFCALQPICTGVYSLLAISYPGSLRPYYLRSVISAVIPIAFTIGAGFLLLILKQSLKADLTSFAKHYDTDVFPRLFWDHIQMQMSCCGIDRLSDWQLLRPMHFDYYKNGTILFPDSCCDTQKLPVGSNCSTSNVEHAWPEPEGCFSRLYVGTLWIGLSFAILAFVQVVFQIATIFLSRWIYKHFENKLFDGRNVMEICLGPLCLGMCKSRHNQFDIGPEDIQYSFPWLRRSTYRRY